MAAAADPLSHRRADAQCRRGAKSVTEANITLPTALNAAADSSAAARPSQADTDSPAVRERRRPGNG